MSEPDENETRTITYRVPTIELYEVSSDELDRIEEGYGQVGNNLTFAVGSLSMASTIAVSMLTTVASEAWQATGLVLLIMFTLVLLVSGGNWLKARKRAPKVLNSIRSRKKRAPLE